MLEGLAPDIAPRLLIAIGGVALAIVVLILVLVFLKRKNSPLFIKGGRAREHRLVVLDAAAVDAKRRLVLIRRDETEHLIMIGGPTDIVIETGINGVNRRTQAEPALHLAEEAMLAADTRAALAAPPKELPSGSRKAEQAVARTEPRVIEAERNQAERRAERQMRRQERAEVAAKETAGNISAAGSVVYGDEIRSRAAENRAAQIAATAENQLRADVSDAPVTSEAEDLLDQAHESVSPDQARQAEAEKAAADEAAVKAMTERLEAARAEALRIEAEKAEAQRIAEAERLEAERIAREQAEAEQAEAARIEAQRAEAGRIEAQRAEAARLQAEQQEAAQAAAQREEAERLAAQRQEAERLYAQQMAARRLEAERLERERAEARRLESIRLRAEAEKRARAEQEARQVQEEAAKRAEAERRQEEADAERQRAVAESQRVEPMLSTPYAEHLADQGADSLASDFEKFLEVELQKGGIFDDGAAPPVQAEPRDAPARLGLHAVPRDPGTVVTGATPGTSVEQDMARRLGEISLNKKTDSA